MIKYIYPTNFLNNEKFKSLGETLFRNKSKRSNLDFQSRKFTNSFIELSTTQISTNRNLANLSKPVLKTG